MDRPTDGSEIQRLRVVIRGAVQGVGFRPFVYRLATEMQLPGWVINSSQGVFIEVEGSKPQLDTFLLRVSRAKPPRSFIQSLESSFLDAVGFSGFEIRHSEESGTKSVLVLPDLATCPDCLHDFSDPANRRYLYPFTNCTNCGPRFSIIEGLPYDRPNTSMKLFAMCDECGAEYGNPLDRRFHAQPNACPRCGPHLELWAARGAGAVLAMRHDALLQAAEAIRRGHVVAIKGIGGFHLVVDARNEEAVRLLRQRKHREEKPFALMYPSLEMVRAQCEVSELEERLLLSPESPIVLMRRLPAAAQQECPLALGVAPRPNPSLGIMLPYTPLHHILMAELGFPIVATSGNLSDEPICIDEHEALDRLGDIADVFLVHNRPIVRHVDDSIVRVVLGREMLLRRARGYAPLPIELPNPTGELRPSVLAVGAHLKNNVAITVGSNVFISQHIGDLETPQAFDAFRRVIADLSRLYEFRPDLIACDMHPDYMSTHFAQDQAACAEPRLPVAAVQHHYAHIVACMADNDLMDTSEPLLGVSWDGTGYGLDGTIWGGEFLLVNAHDPSSPQTPIRPNAFSRFAYLRTFRLPGGDKAVKEPRRTALGVLYEIFGDSAVTRSDLAPVTALPSAERSIVRQMLKLKLNAPVTSSVGRLFDAVAALVGLRQYANFEGQAAMELEYAIATQGAHGQTDDAYPFEIVQVHAGAPAESARVVDWGPMVHAIIGDVQQSLPIGLIAAKFHNMLAETVVTVTQLSGVRKVLLSGGVFQNKYLLERTVGRLQTTGFQPYWHQRVPTNDGGIALGQAGAAVLSHVPIVGSK